MILSKFSSFNNIIFSLKNLKFSNLSSREIDNVKKLNTNFSKGYGNTKIITEDYHTLKKFVSQLPSKKINELGSFAKLLFVYEKNI